jgi:hypothetical protein
MEEALRTWMLAATGVRTLVGQRVDWALRPQGEAIPPQGASIVLHLIDDLPAMNLASPSGWSAARVQVDCWARTHKIARDAAAAVSGLANGFRGTLSNIRIRTFVIDRSTDQGSEAGNTLHRTRLDLRVWWNPAQE